MTIPYLLDISVLPLNHITTFEPAVLATSLVFISILLHESSRFGELLFYLREEFSFVCETVVVSWDNIATHSV